MVTSRGGFSRKRAHLEVYRHLLHIMKYPGVILGVLECKIDIGINALFARNWLVVAIVSFGCISVGRQETIWNVGLPQKLVLLRMFY